MEIVRELATIGLGGTAGGHGIEAGVLQEPVHGLPKNVIYMRVYLRKS